LEQVRRLNPHFALGHGYDGLLFLCGRWQESAARRLSPRDPSFALCSGVFAYHEVRRPQL
jgi:hypothetical protein